MLCRRCRARARERHRPAHEPPDCLDRRRDMAQGQSQAKRRGALATQQRMRWAFVSYRTAGGSGAGLLKETVGGGAGDTVDVDDHSDAVAVGVLLTLGLDDRAVDLVVELASDPSPTVDR